MTLSRDVPIDPDHAALLFIDVQQHSAADDGAAYAGMAAEARNATYGYFLRRMADVALPNMARLQAACRNGGIEVMYTVIESMTADGRDRSLDYKISGIHVPRGALGARLPDALAPAADEMVFPKTSSSVFISTNVDYVLRNMGVRSLILCGVLTDQCVDSAVRDACDLGYLVTVPTDCCATLSAERHDWSLRNNRGYARQVTTAALLEEIEGLTVAR